MPRMLIRHILPGIGMEAAHRFKVARHCFRRATAESADSMVDLAPQCHRRTDDLHMIDNRLGANGRQKAVQSNSGCLVHA